MFSCQMLTHMPLMLTDVNNLPLTDVNFYATPLTLRPSSDGSPTTLRLARFRPFLYFCSRLEVAINFGRVSFTLLHHPPARGLTESAEFKPYTFMKLNGLFGKGTGKVGSSVFSVAGGEQIVRQYNPNVANPNTLAQVNQRARLKLASQIAAALSPVIAIPRNGLKSSRNLFIKENNDAFVANNGTAQVSYENLQLTTGRAGLPSIRATRDITNGIVVRLDSDASAAVSRVVYCAFVKTAENQLQSIGSIVVSTPGQDGDFEGHFDYADGDVVLYAYGMKDKNASAAAKYGNMEVNSGVDIAQLVITRQLSSTDYQFTQTRGTTLFGSSSETINAGDGQVMVYITASGPGSVAGTGFTGNRKAVTIGDSVTVTATPNENCTFLGWKKNGGSNYVSSSASYTFTASELTDLVAYFNDPNSGTGIIDTGDGGD